MFKLYFDFTVFLTLAFSADRRITKNSSSFEVPMKNSARFDAYEIN